MSNDPYFDQERRNKRRVGITAIDGQFDDVQFSLKGPIEKVNAIVSYIRRLTKFMASELPDA